MTSDHAATEPHDVGVIVGRFQVPELHDAHRGLIEAVCAEHDKVLVLLGIAPVPSTPRNPLDFEARKQMLLEAFPRITVAPLADEQDDRGWSRNLDALVGRLTTHAQSAVLYGGRDSFVARYHGNLAVRELDAPVRVSGTEIRDDVRRRSTHPTADFRAGVVWQAYAQYPICHPTVDVAVFDDAGEQLLLGRKPDERLFRFIGGFADPDSPSYEADARREVAEETGIAITDPVYVTSMLVDDWRYRGESARAVKTLLFRATLLSGRPVAADDIEELRWFPWETLADDDVVPVHRPLLAALRNAR